MKVSFFEQWVTFYPSQADVDRHIWGKATINPVTISITEALRGISAICTCEGIEVPVAIPHVLGGGVEIQKYPFQAGQVIHETIITDHAWKAWNNIYFLIYQSKTV